MQDKIKQLLNDGKEQIDFDDFKHCAEMGETNYIERKSIRNFDDINKNKSFIKDMLAKEISAFANHNGGILLIGCEDNGNIEQGTDDTYGNKTKREWLADVIWSCVTPQFKDYAIKTTKDGTGKTLYVVVFGESSNPPHQAAHGQATYRYYSRIDCKSRPLDGIHVRDIFNRQTHANLEPNISIRPYSNPQGAGIAVLDISIKNISLIPAEKVVVKIKAPKDLNIQSSYKMNPNISYGNDFLIYKPEIIYPEIVEYISSVKDNLIILHPFGRMKLDIMIVAKNMLRKDFKITLINHDNENFEVV